MDVNSAVVYVLIKNAPFMPGLCHKVLIAFIGTQVSFVSLIRHCLAISRDVSSCFALPEALRILIGNSSELV